jgi:hypothetical protein
MLRRLLSSGAIGLHQAPPSEPACLIPTGLCQLAYANAVSLLASITSIAVK